MRLACLTRVRLRACLPACLPPPTPQALRARAWETDYMQGTCMVRMGMEVGGIIVSLRPDKAVLPGTMRGLAC